MAHRAPFHMPHPLQIRVPNTRRLIIGMAHIVPKAWGLSANITFPAHNPISFQLPRDIIYQLDEPLAPAVVPYLANLFY
jgi:hypothetical protein